MTNCKMHDTNREDMELEYVRMKRSKRSIYCFNNYLISNIFYLLYRRSGIPYGN